MKRKVYLDMKPLEEARLLFLDSFEWIELAGEEMVPVAQALGRITAEPVFAVFSSPHYHAAAMDGVALKAAVTFGADDKRPVRLKVGKEAFFLNTGNPLPAKTDAVVMIEQVHQPDPETVELRAAAFPWQHVRKVGEDIVAQEMLLPHHHRLRAADQAALLTAGVFQVKVIKKPKVAIIPTGSELVDWQEATKDPPAPGVIIESNSLLLASLVREIGGEAVVMDRVPDQPQDISSALDQALNSDAHLVVLNAGASSGTKDYTVHVVGELGEVLVHGVTVMPGKPTILARAKGKPVVGSPGYAVSAWVCFDQFIGPALARMQGQEPVPRETLEVIPARPLPSKLGQEEFVRVHLGRVGGNIVATPLKRGAGTITSLIQADGVVRIPHNSEGLSEGEPAKAELLVPRLAVEKTLVIVGSHDITLDLLADHMTRLEPGIRVSSSHVGSLSGLMSIKAGRCHLGGTHLLDPETGEYNISYLQRYLKELPVRLVTLAYRQQGLMVKKDNPKNILSFDDLARKDVSLVNRQGGSGTRVLLDYHLSESKISPDDITGYDNEEYTHMAVAVQVLSGGADVGLGVLAAARALGLDFLPLVQERYDLCIPIQFLDDPRIIILLETLQSPAFQKAVQSLGGYDVTPMGQTAWEG
ncbi:MAG: molybdopterin biosynthesis protein [Desulfarculaceae bacterium]|jgi:putative molybdopterin biosynthesis protein